MRVIAGQLRGMRLSSVGGHQVRPTSDRVRESLFAILGEAVVGSRFLDLFAGVGGVGIEAASRGAVRVVFVEKSHEVARVLKENVDRADLSATAQIIVVDVVAALRRLQRAGARFDFVFLDPPYEASADTALEHAGGVTAPRAEVIVQHRAADLPRAPAELTLFDQRRYGESALSFYRAPRPVEAQNG